MLSVVIAAVNEPRYLDACLGSLPAGDTEIVVVHAGRADVAALLHQSYPHVHELALTPPRTLGELRAAGVAAAGGEIIALTEDHCLLPPEWLRQLAEAHETHAAGAIGGAVDTGATERLVDRLAYWFEYGPFASPAPAGPVNALPGPNVSYKRAVLEAFRPVWQESFDEGELHRVMQAAGDTLWSEPGLRVQHKKHYTLGEYMRERFHYSRWFAGRRAGGWRRLLYLPLTPLLPLLLTWRAARPVWKRPEPFWRLLPLFFLAALVGTAGEAVGYLFGSGRSARFLR